VNRLQKVQSKTLCIMMYKMWLFFFCGDGTFSGNVWNVERWDNVGST